MPGWYSTSSMVMAWLAAIVSGMASSVGTGEANWKFKPLFS
jgi:hypothetical protein